MKLFKKVSVAFALLFVSVTPVAIIEADAATMLGSPTGYTQASQVQYVTSGKYIANWGSREEDCVFLTTYAQSFYTGSYTYDVLANQKGGSSQSDAYSSALYKSLQTLMKSKHSYQTSYAATRDLYCYTDCVNSNYSKISSFYSGQQLSGTWDGGSTWNREHTWPNSKGLGGNDENDIMMLRPTSVQENSSRGNTAYGQSSGYYNPNSEGGGKVDLRGDCARIFLYTYVRWGNTSYAWGKSGVMESMDVLLQWMEADPVDTWEMGRNDAVQSITGTRNVFVDYPEFAWLLFGKAIPSNMPTPSGEASDGEYGSSGGDVVVPDDSSSSDNGSSDTGVDNETDNSGSEDSGSNDNNNATSGDSIVTFEFGENKGSAHVDGNDLGATKAYTENGYTVNLTNMSKVYGPSYDAKGNSCVKIGASSTVGSLSFTVGADVAKVVLRLAKYKSNASTVKINGTSYTLTKNSNDGEYDVITIDTTSTKTITIETISGATRAMLNSIELVGYGESETSCAHQFGAWKVIKEPTVEEEGQKSRQCGLCDAEEFEVIPKLVADNSSSDSSDNSAEGDTCEHHFSEWFIQNATETQDGKKWRICEHCGDVEVEVIPTLGGGVDSGEDIHLEAGCSSALTVGGSLASLLVLAGCAMTLKKKKD